MRETHPRGATTRTSEPPSLDRPPRRRARLLVRLSPTRSTAIPRRSSSLSDGNVSETLSPPA